ncbi:1755_t:CDS:10 [Paraglomus brasilianum]|uniref:1755_t:CDS:1 n=1 Tax=Paraglomus brasilianum TaxID=144538 RepID=A0A9N9AZW3_9GLOM|nr:1755_t:CDS:10 [Paraglomus brasilianum]
MPARRTTSQTNTKVSNRKKKKVVIKKGKGKQAKVIPTEPKAASILAKKYPDKYWQCHAQSGHEMINYINEDHPLELVGVDVHDHGPITGMILSPDGTMLATFCNVGTTKIWDTSDFKLIQKLRDEEETNIDEFFVGRFTPDHTKIVVAGKLKDRTRWSYEDDDNHILPCPLKIFDCISGRVIAKLEGHAEEVLFIKSVVFKGESYYISTSQDGYIYRWKMQDDWTTLIESKPMEDGITCMAFTVSFVPNTGNKYFLAATDEHIRLYDFEEAQLLQTFSDMYSQYCDCGKFIHPVVPLEEKPEEFVDTEGANGHTSKRTRQRKFAYFISRGVEILDSDDGTVALRPNSCILHKLIYPLKKGDPFTLKEVRRYQHKEYQSNSWLIKITSNGRYILAPTNTGKVLVFDLQTGALTGILHDHEEINPQFIDSELEVRDVICHPWKPLLLTCADDGCVKVYTYENIEEKLEDVILTDVVKDIPDDEVGKLA